jgi:cobalt/nickel transport system permease protein
MHIPDGYLSPKTCLVFYAGMVPVWYIASRRVEKTVNIKELPLLALGGAFAFVIMMFNIPVPGGSSGHMVGSTIVAVVLGPWAGVVALSLTLALQALLFADGGITTFGANCFNMAFVASFSGYYLYRALSALIPNRRPLAAALAAYAAINLSALAAAVELGVQPLIAAGANGRPLYAPYPLNVAIPAMMVPHLLFFGPVEAIGTALVVSYVMKEGGLKETGKRLRPLWAFLVLLVLLTPLGLIAAGTSWGEWGRVELSRLIGYVPAGMGRFNGWNGVMPRYTLPWASGRFESAAFYVISAALGSILVVVLVFLWGKLWRR